MVDSGANVVVVPEGDPSIIPHNILDGPQRVTTLWTANNSIEVPIVKIRTPIGILEGLVSPNSPRLLPGNLFDEIASAGCLRTAGFLFDVVLVGVIRSCMTLRPIVEAVASAEVSHDLQNARAASRTSVATPPTETTVCSNSSAVSQ